MNRQSIIDEVQNILLQADASMSEYELLIALTERSALFAEQQSNDHNLSLFQKNFIVMNALYQLQQKLMVDNLYVAISALAIRIEKITASHKQALVTQPGEQKLRDYYLDWDNFAETDADDVEKLLSSFWQIYIAQDQRAVAYQDLDLVLDSGWNEVKTQYRRLAILHHPDKGGNENQFKKIRKAYEILQRCLN